jgi:hypothetical protein
MGEIWLRLDGLGRENWEPESGGKGANPSQTEDLFRTAAKINPLALRNGRNDANLAQWAECELACDASRKGGVCGHQSVECEGELLGDDMTEWAVPLSEAIVGVSADFKKVSRERQ